MKPNPLLARMEAQYNAKLNQKIGFTIQLCGDIAMIAANEVFNMGPGRVEKFAREYERLVDEVGVIMWRDAEYMQDKVDERLKKICGDKFQPWAERYGK